MATILLTIIYISFISLGLPDSLLGSSWPVMHLSLGADITLAGIISFIVAFGTIVSSLLSVRLIKLMGTGKTTAVSVLMTAVALFMFNLAPSFIWLCIAAIPLGLGAGAVDSVLNNFVALHYKAKHMNWLHCFWGIGATAGPIIMSLFIAQQNGWRSGYLTISIIQGVLVASLFASLPLWKKFESNLPQEKKAEVKTLSLVQAGKIKGALAVFITFFCYCSVECTAGLWGSTYLVTYRGLSPADSAMIVSLFFMGITVGRFLSGLLSLKLNNTKLVRLGLYLCIAGCVILILPLNTFFAAVGLVLLGLGCAPIYPAMLHETPVRFGKDISQALMGIQMACAYIGTTLMPPLFGVIGNTFGMVLFPIFLLIITVIMLFFSEKANKVSFSNQ